MEIKRGDYVIKVGNRKVLDGVMEAIGLGGEENAGRRLIVLRAIDKLDRLGPDGVRLLLGKGRKDESGDFTKGAGLREEHIGRVIQYVSFGAGFAQNDWLPPNAQTAPVPLAEGYSYYDNNTLLVMQNAVGSNSVGQEGVKELRIISELVRAASYGANCIRVDSSVVRGLEYYTGPVFEAELTVPGEDGKPVRFGSVGGGGRYDGLVGRFRGENVPATGFSIGVSRLFAALKQIKSPIVATYTRRGPVVVLVLDEDQLPRYQGFVTSLRNAKDPVTGKPSPISAELYLGQSGMNAQLKYANKRGSICAVIQGSNERNHRNGPQLTIRDLVLGAELAASTKDRADYLELRANAQFTVPEDRLVESVQEVLARHV